MPSKVEFLKIESDGLRRGLREALADPAPGVSEESYQLLKFHGMYLQEDRDTRRSRKAEGLGPDHSFMIRAAIPGGCLAPEQYLATDDLAGRLGLDGLRLTTRQNIQFHRVLKGQLPTLMADLNAAFVTTLSGCGDVVRNVVCCPSPTAPGRGDLLAVARAISDRLKPQTRAYAELWLGEERVWSSIEPEEPFYGATYLPRKFKIGLTVEHDNCIDVYSQDIGIVGHLDAALGRLTEFTVLVGGGLARSHGVAQTQALLAKPLTRVPADELVDVLAAIVAVQRDHGNRENRKFARLKYLVAERGMKWMGEVVSAQAGRALPAPGPLLWQPVADHLGYAEGPDGRGCLGVRVPSGRLRDGESGPVRTALRAVVERFRPTVHITAMQNVLLGGLTASQAAEAETMLADGGLRPAASLGPVERHAMACPALPTCGLALAEAERVFPPLARAVEERWQAAGAGDVDLHVRMTGCPNNCARPFLAEIGIVGRTLGKYAIYLGASPDGTRLATMWADQVPLDQIADAVTPVFAAYARDARPGERLGDFCNRIDLEPLRPAAKAAER